MNLDRICIWRIHDKDIGYNKVPTFQWQNLGRFSVTKTDFKSSNPDDPDSISAVGGFLFMLSICNFQLHNWTAHSTERASIGFKGQGVSK